MAIFDQSPPMTQCPVCLRIDLHIVGEFKTREENGILFDADMPDAEALSLASRKFTEHAFMKCDGSITHDCLDQYVQLELLEPTSPLSMLVTKRIRALKCPHCGFLTKLSRLP